MIRKKSKTNRLKRPLLFFALALLSASIFVHKTAAFAPGVSESGTPGQEVQKSAQRPQFTGPDYQRALPTADLIIDAGHGGIDGGAHYKEVLEKDINLAIAKKVYLLLRSSGVRAVLNRNGDYALSDDNRWHPSRSRHKRDLSQRSQLSGEIEARIVISLHVNWARNEKVRGPLVLHQEEGQSALLAYCIQDALNRQQQTRFLPKSGKPFYLLNVVKQPAVIVEMGFISHEGDREMLTDPRKQQQVAAAIASGVRNYILIR